ncbi:hypothetical protein Tco_1031323 [Tanacetum coccineum]|uniref:Uncharacterized protein n=1 Tax=Tanacetum coccineum TaxID=301880 RepID=A0ABQ5GAY1_9ASTR
MLNGWRWYLGLVSSLSLKLQPIPMLSLCFALANVSRSKFISASVAEVPSASALQVLRRLGSIFTSVYAAVQKLKKDSWLELQFSLADNSKLNVVYLLNRS